MSAPRKYPPQFRPEDWNLMCDFFSGFTPSGTFVNANDFTITTDGAGVYSASNASQTVYGGTADAGGADGHSLVDVANACTSFGAPRSKYIKICFKGNFTSLTDDILLYDYTVIDAYNAKFFLANGANCNIFTGEDLVNGNSFIKIFGGIYDCNGANQASEGRCVHIAGSYSSNDLVQDAYIANAAYISIDFDNPTESSIINCTLKDHLFTGMRLHSTDRCTIRGCNFYPVNTATDLPQVYCDGRENTITGNHFQLVNAVDEGVYLADDGAYDIYGNLITDNTFVGTGAQTGFGVLAAGTHLFGNTIANNFFYNLDRGIYLNSNNTKVFGNQFYTSNFGVAEGVSGDYNYITDNYFDTATITAPVFLNGTNTKVRYNQGYLTENCGLVVFDSEAFKVVPHGLSTTPNNLTLQTNDAVCGILKGTDADATNFTITPATAGAYTVYWNAKKW
jgi:hypothetical protein